MTSGIIHLIVCSPYDETKHHWHHHRGTRAFEPGKHGRVAVTIVDDREIESLKILEIAP